MNKLNLDSRQVYLLEEFFSGLESISLQIESASEYLKNGDIKSALISLERTGKKVKSILDVEPPYDLPLATHQTTHPMLGHKQQ